MNEKTETRNMALFCDFENVALGVRDAKYTAFDIQKVLDACCSTEGYLICGGPGHHPAASRIQLAVFAHTA